MPPLAIERVRQADGAFVHRPGDDDDFERRAGFHHVADDAVAARISGRSPGIVRIKIWQRHHRQNLARARTRNDGGDADGRVFLQRVGQRGFHDVLNRRVNGQHHVQAVARLHIFIAQRDQLMLLTVRLRHAPARHAAQRRIQNQLHAVAPDGLRNVVAAILRSHETERVRRQRAVRIHAQLIVHRVGKNRARAQIAEKRAGGPGQFFFVHAE